VTKNVRTAYIFVHMRTTVDLDDHLFRDLKRQAAERGITLRDLVNELLRRGLELPKRRPRYRFCWKVDPRGTIQPGVRLNDRKLLFDLM
jgi:hypothetical protein